MERICQGCQAVIPPQQGSARPRKYCTTCRPPRNRPNPRVIHLQGRAEPAARAPKEVPASGLVASYRAQLAEADRLDSPEGALVLHLAELFTSGKHTAAGAAGLSRELRAAMEQAMRGAPRKADAVDEMAERRRRKASSA